MTDREKNIERGLDLAGREKVFALVRSYGWTSRDSIPHWVWERAISEALRAERPVTTEAKEVS